MHRYVNAAPRCVASNQTKRPPGLNADGFRVAQLKLDWERIVDKGDLVS
jgi:hypothetical protein